jgi:hypothetical protein
VPCTSESVIERLPEFTVTVPLMRLLTKFTAAPMVTSQANDRPVMVCAVEMLHDPDQGVRTTADGTPVLAAPGQPEAGGVVGGGVVAGGVVTGGRVGLGVTVTVVVDTLGGAVTVTVVVSVVVSVNVGPGTVTVGPGT